MSVNQTVSRSASESVRRPFSLRTFSIGGAILAAIVIGLRLYEQAFGWSKGLDSFSEEYGLYWHTLLVVSIPVSVLAAVAAGGYLWRTRDRSLASIAPAEELRRYHVLAQLLALYGIALFLGLSFFTEQTAVWHLTAVRDSDFTPSNIITFYISYPLFVVVGVTAYAYAVTRLPYFAKGVSLPFGLLLVGTFMTIPNIGLNEWGHTFWVLDEGFASPLHWGFAFFGWMALGSFGVTLQILGRLRELLGPECIAVVAGRRK
ncbi:MAG: methane monooxygenase/ammonia monooxygenase subunit C [Methylocystis sp.]